MIKFYSILDFYPNKVEIKKEFDKLTTKEMLLYKKEVYSLCFEQEYVKDLIWEYLNGDYESQFDLGKQWRLKKEKMEKRKKNESSNTNKVE